MLEIICNLGMDTYNRKEILKLKNCPSKQRNTCATLLSNQTPFLELYKGKAL